MSGLDGRSVSIDACCSRGGTAQHPALLFRAAPCRPCRLDCPALRVEAQLMARNEALVFAALAALQPARPLRDIVDR